MHQINLDRLYIRSAYGLLHLRRASPQNARHPPLICLHNSPGSGRVFDRVLTEFGGDRIVIAPDTPGYGMSDAPAAQPDSEAFANALLPAADIAGAEQFDVLGYHTGAVFAVELAHIVPRRVGRLILAGVPATTLSEHAGIFRGSDGQEYPRQPEASGEYLVDEWRRTLAGHAQPGMSVERLQDYFTDKLIAGPRAFWGSKAALASRFVERLSDVMQPILAIAPEDDLWAYADRIPRYLQNGTLIKCPGLRMGMFDVADPAVFAAMRAHLDRCPSAEGASP